MDEFPVGFNGWGAEPKAVWAPEFAKDANPVPWLAIDENTEAVEAPWPKADGCPKAEACPNAGGDFAALS